MMGCPVCSMCFGMSAHVSKSEEGFTCSSNPQHRFRLGTDGFLMSI
ncbi:hypothetical protein KKD40_04105 [Candidatus Micrarchaeota archaeon]|nr:hypothetical protein [Candidatus Micrarchaeota archaeon]